MPETVNLPGARRPMNRTLVYAAAAATVGIVGYAWWTRGSRAGATPKAEFLVPEEPTGVLPFSGTQSGTFTQGPVAYRNDQEWYQAALQRLLYDYGVPDTPTAGDALDRYLANRPLTATQVPMINFVINTIGPPPSGARNIRQETPPGGTTPPPSAQLSSPSPVVAEVMGKAHVNVQWANVPGAVAYEIRRVTADGTSATPWLNIGNNTSNMQVARVTQPTAFGWEVRAVGPGDVKGPAAGTVGHTLVYP